MEMTCEKRFVSDDGRTIMLLRDKNFNCEIVISHDGKLEAREEFIDPFAASKRYELLVELVRS